MLDWLCTPLFERGGEAKLRMSHSYAIRTKM